MQLNNPASGGNRSDNLVDKVIVVTEVGPEEDVQTKDYGLSTAVKVQVRVVAGFPGEETLSDNEEYLIFWQVVKTQLLESPIPVAGRIIKRGRAYVLDSLDSETLSQVQLMLDQEA